MICSLVKFSAYTLVLLSLQWIYLSDFTSSNTCVKPYTIRHLRVFKPCESKMAIWNDSDSNMIPLCCKRHHRLLPITLSPNSTIQFYKPATFFSNCSLAETDVLDQIEIQVANRTDRSTVASFTSWTALVRVTLWEYSYFTLWAILIFYEFIRLTKLNGKKGLHLGHWLDFLIWLTVALACVVYVHVTIFQPIMWC